MELQETPCDHEIPQRYSILPGVCRRHRLFGCPAADVGETISVAASDLSTKFNSTDRIVKDGFYTFSNLGSCVDIFAPGGTSQASTCHTVRLHGA